MSAELNILRHELAETRRKLDAEKSYATECAAKLCEAQDECARLRRDNEYLRERFNSHFNGMIEQAKKLHQ